MRFPTDGGAPSTKPIKSPKKFRSDGRRVEAFGKRDPNTTFRILWMN